MTDTRTTDGETRRQILASILTAGTLTATELAAQLGLSAAGIRRHLDNLVEEDIIETAPARTKTTGRGRPAKAFRLTETGRAHFGHSYDELAAQALRTFRRTGGDEAVRQFARQRAKDIMEGIERPQAEDADALRAAADAVVAAFTHNGYAASVNTAEHGVQICQHHCPIAGVAAEFPELCEAEHEVIASLLGHHVQPLASIVEGHGICTTNIPITPIHPRKTNRKDRERP